MTTSQREAAAALRREIVQRIGEPRYQFWFEPNTVFSWEDGLLTVGVPNHFFQEWFQKTFSDAVRAAAAAVTGRPMEIRFAIHPALFQATRRAQQEADAAAPPAGRESVPPGAHPAPRPTADRPPAPVTRPRPTRTRKWHRLGDFVVGPCNRLAHACAVSLVEAPEDAVNPLVLHGPVGTGKTHLLEGIYAGLRKARPGWRICFVTSEEFTNRFVQAMRLGKLTAFRRHFRDCDALLVDDLQFLAGKAATQEEFLHTFDVLLANERPVVLTCDCHPRLAGDLSPELTDRLAGGGVWGLMPPDPQTRLDLVRSKAAREALPLPDAVVQYLGQELRGNVREIEGALASLRHFTRVTERPPDLAAVRQLLGDLRRHTARAYQLADVESAVCRALGLPPTALREKGRSWAVAQPRMLAIFLARRHTAAAYSEIGRYFGGRNHSTAVAAEKRVRQWLRENSSLTLGGRSLPVRDVIESAERELNR